ncbi:hypothetical protein DM860_009148 [Cuscuta australis]|uniref:Uncharacterized protein n=1 Tax=Cuscuta australis TaxID=267555 RepID=A0A328DEH9_9ASTE|nr:hypothetical protein DM860_009148 [Cuscuta australis]
MGSVEDEDMETTPSIDVDFGHVRDTYGFTVRPQHQREEEAKRSHKWNSFVNSQELSVQQLHCQEVCKTDDSETRNHISACDNVVGETGDLYREKPLPDIHTKNLLEKETSTVIQSKPREVKTWNDIRSSLSAIETMMAFRVKNKNYVKDMKLASSHDQLLPIWESKPLREEYEDKNDESNSVILDDSSRSAAKGCTPGDRGQVEPSVPWKDELEQLVHRGDLPRNFPGHPALNENGRNSLRRLLLARHNPSVGYC